MPAVPGFIIRAVLGEFGSVLLKGQRVIPQKLLAQGFLFRFPGLREAFKEITAEGE
jgi:NAD dependent epimerase/dehydratase family enzyme